MVGVKKKSKEKGQNTRDLIPILQFLSGRNMLKNMG